MCLEAQDQTPVGKWLYLEYTISVTVNLFFVIFVKSVFESSFDFELNKMQWQWGPAMIVHCAELCFEPTILYFLHVFLVAWETE